MASNSSNKITCKAALSIPRPPLRRYGSYTGGGLSNNSRKFFSELPTNLSINCGPLTTVKGRACENNVPIVLANNVFPQPLCPYNNTPRTGVTPNSNKTEGGAANGVQTRRLISWMTSSNPPTPKVSPSNFAPLNAMSSEECACANVTASGETKWVQVDVSSSSSSLSLSLSFSSSLLLFSSSSSVSSVSRPSSMLLSLLCVVVPSFSRVFFILLLLLLLCFSFSGGRRTIPGR
mmetsp:Transcript_51178/g.57973  ORF Transcript_51178/g.57973 Transcript_51178/m.57973 type:complete len:234 (+) Transcript_51178:213-914(+)